MKIEATYDIIIAGGGLSGLSLAWYLAKGGYDKQVLVVDSTFAPVNNKTWCFWTNQPPPFLHILYRKWEKARVSVSDYETFQNLNEFNYYCIRSSDFKECVLKELRQHKNFHLAEENILDLSSNKDKAILLTKNGKHYLADYIFQSIKPPQQLDPSEVEYSLVQHFLGYEIKTNNRIFDPETFTLMDFENNFSPGIGFIYVLPFSPQHALIEFTVFSKSVLAKTEYKQRIALYLQQNFKLDEKDYEVKRQEYGEIPMEIRPHIPFYNDGTNIVNLGTVGGQTKPTTGYTFLRIQDYTQQLSQSLITDNRLVPPPQSPKRFRYYDLWLLHILSTSSEESLLLFKSLFKNNKLDEILRFLGEDSSFFQDLKIMSSVPSRPFLKAIWKNFF